MSNLTLKQKIILGAIIGVMLIVIGIYGYISLNKEEDLVSLEDMANSDVVNSETANNETNQNSQNINNEPNNNTLENTSGQNDQEKNGYENLEGKIVVHITGEVNKTGILILSEGARIADAIDNAGGAKEEADLDEINLAYVLEDGQKIYIPNKADKNSEVKKEYITSESGKNVIVDGQKTNGGVSNKVNINTANQSELETLPGIGEAIAKRIIEYREQNGKFSKVDDLKNVKGIGEAKFENIKEYVVVK